MHLYGRELIRTVSVFSAWSIGRILLILVLGMGEKQLVERVVWSYYFQIG